MAEWSTCSGNEGYACSEPASAAFYSCDPLGLKLPVCSWSRVSRKHSRSRVRASKVSWWVPAHRSPTVSCSLQTPQVSSSLLSPLVGLSLLTVPVCTSPQSTPVGSGTYSLLCPGPLRLLWFLSPPRLCRHKHFGFQSPVRLSRQICLWFQSPPRVSRRTRFKFRFNSGTITVKL